MHVDEGTLQAYLDGELPPGEQADVEAHLEECGACAAELNELGAVHGELSLLLARADVAPPVAQAQLAMRGRRARLAEGAGRFGGEARRALLRAAVLVLALAGVAAAAVPGSPVRAWIEESVLAPRAEQEPTLDPEAPAPRPEPAPEAAAPAGEPRGPSILPERGSIRVVLEDAKAGLRLRVRLTDSELGGAVALGSTPATFAIGSTGAVIRVMAAGPGEVIVSLPRAARTAYVEVNGRTYVAKDGGLRALVPSTSGNADELLFLID